MPAFSFNSAINTVEVGWSIFNDPQFEECRQAMNAVMKKSAAEGKEIPVKRSKTISLSDERKLWQNGAFGSSNPKQLLNSLIYHLGLHLSLRAAQENRDLEFGETSQIALCMEDNEI